MDFIQGLGIWYYLSLDDCFSWFWLFNCYWLLLFPSYLSHERVFALLMSSFLMGQIWFKFHSNWLFVKTRPPFIKFLCWLWASAWWKEVLLEGAWLSWDFKLNVLNSLWGNPCSSHDFTCHKIQMSLWHKCNTLLRLFPSIACQIVNDVWTGWVMLEETHSTFSLSCNKEDVRVFVIGENRYSCVVVKLLFNERLGKVS